MDIATIKPFLDYGIISGLFVFVLLFVLRTSREDKKMMMEENKTREERMLAEGKAREEKLYSLINEVTQKFDLLAGKIEELGDKIEK